MLDSGAFDVLQPEIQITGALEIRKLAHDLSNALEIIVQTSFLLGTAGLKEPALEWHRWLAVTGAVAAVAAALATSEPDRVPNRLWRYRLALFSAAALVAAGLLSVLVFPLAALTLVRGDRSQRAIQAR